MNVKLKCIKCLKDEVEYLGKCLVYEDDTTYTTACKYRCNACGKQMAVHVYHIKEHCDISKEHFDIF